MATGGELRQSIDISSDIVYEFSCTPCGNDGKNNEALFYCVECVERFCSACLRNHNRYAVLKTHQILDKAAMVAMGPQPVYALPTERCPDHHGNLIDTYCPGHRDVCCSTCVSIDHRSCESITYIPIAAKDITESKDYKNIKPTIQRIKRRLETMKTTMHEDLQKLHREKANALKQIADFRKFIDNELKRIEKYVTDDLQSRHTVIEKGIKSNIKSLEDMISTLESSLQKIQKVNVDNESEIFVQIKLGEKRKSDGESLLHNLELCSVSGSLTFTENEELHDFMTNIDNIGKITYSNDSSSSPKNIIKSDGKEQKITPLVKYDVKYQKPTQIQQVTPNDLTDSATLCHEYNVKLSDDENFCDIIGCCQLQDGTYLISDTNNNRLKRLNTTLKVVNSCRLNSSPLGICVVGTMEVAVALDCEKKVQFVSVGDKLQPTRSFKTDMPCSGCEYSNDCLWVSSNSEVAMFNKAGQLLKQIKLKLPHTSYANSCMICNKDKTNIYVSNFTKKVLVLDGKGKQIASIKDPELKEAANICVLDNDDILICCHESNKILRFNSDGRKLGVLLQKADGLYKPQSICLDRINSRLIVTSDTSNQINVYNLR